MANFVDYKEAIVSYQLEFVQITEDTLQQINCKNGEISGFIIKNLNCVDGPLQVSQIYDCSNGTPLLIGTVSVVKGMDLTGGLFSSGVFCDGDPTDINTKFYQVDY